ncbi:RNA polymerase sigma factor SigZ [Roseovarius sp. EL26]|uniref:RNA polymerase sigma factor SigZ n=1 Tax=Roseovarius sp. EL26 TaxID=2126672 RepID=UPI000EA1D093|nr:RNA polymerase sigma factor SigZ [Roseovarius sp. EL26]
MTIEQIWHQYRARLKAFLHSKVSNPADVEDLLQDISIKTVTSIDTLEDLSKIQAWLFQIAHRTIIDFYRTKGRAKDIHPDDLWYLEEETQVLRDFEACIEPFLASLPTDTAQMLRSIDIEGQSQKDYGAAHGIAYSTLKSRIQKGRSELRNVFESCCHLTLDARGHITDYHPKSDNCGNC